MEHKIKLAIVEDMAMVKKKKIVIGLNNLVVGGAQHQLIQQLQYFDTEKFEINVFLLVHDSSYPNLLTSVPKHIQVHTFAFSGFSDISSWFVLYRELRDMRPDLVVSSLFFSNTVLRVLKLFLGYPSISREHNTYVNKRWVHIQIDRLLSTWTKKIVAVSEEVADFTSKQERIPRKKFLVINNGVDIKAIEQTRKTVDPSSVRAELKIAPRERVLLYVGRLVKQKNLKLLLNGFSEFRKTRQDWRLVIVGGGLQLASLEELTRALRLENAVVMAGEKKDVHPYYAIADCFITTSFIEGMSNTHLEALAHGLPIVSTKTGGTSSVIKEGINGYIISEYSPESVSEALTKIATSDLDVMKRASRMVAQNFDIRATVKKYEELFEQYAL